MRIFIFAAGLLLCLPAYSEKLEVLQKFAHDRFITKKEVPVRVGPHPAKQEEIKFEEPIDKVTVTNIKNKAMAALKGYIAYVQSLDTDKDYVEIFFEAGDEKLNCYAAFENGELLYLSKCKKTKTESDGD